MSGLNSGIAAIGIDIAKNSFHVVGPDERLELDERIAADAQRVRLSPNSGHGSGHH